MMTPVLTRRPSLSRRLALTCLCAAIGIAVGWRYSSAATVFDRVVPICAAVSASVLGVEVLRTGGRRRLWLVPLAALLLVRALWASRQ
jgi:hypothetical protein